MHHGGRAAGGMCWHWQHLTVTHRMLSGLDLLPANNGGPLRKTNFLDTPAGSWYRPAYGQMGA